MAMIPAIGSRHQRYAGCSRACRTYGVKAAGPTAVGPTVGAVTMASCQTVQS
jgi:hypothetical protein